MRPYFEEDGITIYHGDCRDLLPQLNLKPGAIVTDPPYGIDLRPGLQDMPGNPASIFPESPETTNPSIPPTF